MSHKNHHKKNRSETENCRKPCIISRNKNYDSSSEYSSRGLSDLCEDQPRSYYVKNDSESSDSSDSSEYNLKSIGNHSRTSILKSLESSDSKSECNVFDKLVCDEKRKCETKERKPKREIGSMCSSRGKKFIVSFKEKDCHQWSKYNETNTSIYINGKNGPVLHLYRGNTYFFCVENCGDSSSDPENFFFLTDSPCGGEGSKPVKGGFAPIYKGCVSFKVEKCTPRYFFYQSCRESFQGGLVIVHDN